jgi:Ca2+-binding RTX toxin-like protein
VYSGRIADYTISTDNGVTTIADRGAYQDGRDTLTNVRFAQFSDGMVALHNAAPDQVGLSKAAVAEDTPPNAAVATLSSHDADGDAVTYSLVSDGDGFFRLDGDHLVLARALDYETQAHQHNVSVKAADPYGGETVATFTVSVTDVADTPAVPLPPADLMLRGTAHADRLSGQAGNDTLYGGAGKDVLTGGSGKDVFVFDTRPDTKKNVDKITDFSVTDDSIWLDNKVFAKLGKGTAAHPGKLNKAFFTLGDHAKDKNDHLIYDSKKGVL